VRREVAAGAASTGIANGGVIDSAHIALDSDCFSNATASPAGEVPAWIRLAATDPGRAADRAGCVHPQQRLPTAPSASAGTARAS